jgi:hypothetical protein
VTRSDALHTSEAPAPASPFTRWLLAATLSGCGHPQSSAADDGASSRSVSSTLATVAAHEATPGADARTLDMPARARDLAPNRAFEVREDAVRASLASTPIEEVELGKGGRSVSFKLVLADGTVGFFKPEQHFAAHWYAELAAYYVDRALGLHRVPPAIGRRVAWSQLEDVAKGSKHAREVVVQPDGTVRGAFIWWVPERLVPLDPPEGWEAWLSIDPLPAVSPFQRHADYRRALERAGEREQARASTSVPPPRPADRAAELSDLVLFDLLIDNADRWGGNFTNVRSRGKDGPLVFLDNAGGFHRGREPDARMLAQLALVQRMRARTIEAMRDLDLDELRASMAGDPLAPVLSDAHFEQLEKRRRSILRHAEETIARHGAAATPW